MSSFKVIKESVMAAEGKHTCYEGSYAQSFQFYLKHSGEHEAILQCVQKVLPEEFKSIAAGKNNLDVLGVGSGGGEVDVQMLTLLQSKFPAVPITTDIVEGSSPLVDNFKALVGKTASLQKIPFAWHVMHSGDYEKQVKAKGDMKKFDFIHMIQMIYYVDNLADTIKFFHSILKTNGRLMIIIEQEVAEEEKKTGFKYLYWTNDAPLGFVLSLSSPLHNLNQKDLYCYYTTNGGWDKLWKTYQKELCVDVITEYRSSAEVIACLKSQGLKYDEHVIPNTFDITECYDPSSANGERLLSFMTGKDHFSQSFTPEIRAGILDLLKTKCSTEKDGRVMFNSQLSCILVHA